jgi:histidinol-phosphate aminotransferase
MPVRNKKMPGENSFGAASAAAGEAIAAELPVRRAILDRRTYEPPAEGRAKKLRLDFNENTAGCSRAVVRALAKLSPKQLAMYPEYQRPTRRLAQYFGVQPEELLLTNGGDDALRVFFDAFVDAGSAVLICEPTFPMYRYYAEIAGARVEAMSYGADMEFPLKSTLAALQSKPRVLFIANPNNPTGTLLQPEAIETILRAATNTAVVIDEAYAEFSEVTVVPWIGKHPHLFIARTFSKAAGLAALRLGAVIACAESLAFVRRAMPPFPVNLAALVAAEAALQERVTMRRYVHGIKVTRAWFAKELRQLGVKTYPSAGNFVLANFGPAGPELFRRLERRGILLRERTREIGVGFVRITIGTRGEMQRLIKEIKRCR